MNKQLDVLFVSADSSLKAYQDLSKDFAAIEPPTWALLLAQSCRSVGLGVAIIDCTAERLTMQQAVTRIEECNPRLVCFVVYGQNPNSGTTNMTGALALSHLLKEQNASFKTCFVGSHTSALPKEVLSYPWVDFILLNEGVYALRNLLQTNLSDHLEKVKGIGFKRGNELILNDPEQIVPQNRMDIDLPGYAWDLLPYREKPLDLYRSHFWHANFDHEIRTPFAAIYTSLGCRFKCDFCMINIVNRVDNTDGIVSANSTGMRFWSPELMLAEFEKLASLGVSTIRISDEMFFLNKNYFEPLVDGIIDRGLNLHMWAYSRVDTVRSQYLEKFRKAGILWLALGVEAGSQTVRREVSKGSFEDVDIREVIKTVRNSDINVISNFIFGFPDDTLDTMNQTLDLALELCTEMANMYPCMALPGSPLHNIAKDRGWKLPDTHEGYGFLSYECEPLPTKYLSAADVLKFRDEAWQKYFTYPKFLELINTRFGALQRKNVEEMTKIKLKRKLLGD